MKAAAKFIKLSFTGGALKRHLIVKPIYATNPINGERARIYLLISKRDSNAGAISIIDGVLADCFDDRTTVRDNLADGTWSSEEPVIVPWAVFQSYLRHT